MQRKTTLGRDLSQGPSTCAKVRAVTSRRVIVWVSLASTLVLVFGPVQAAPASVLVIGDSLAVGTEPALRAALPSALIEADVRNGRFSSEGVTALAEQLSPEHETVIFDLGTNDGPRGVDATARSLVAARELATGRCLIVATLNHPPVGGASIADQNTMIREFAASTHNVALVDWHGAGQTPGALRSDGVHATSAGYALRGALFAEAIQGCSSVGAPGGRAMRGPGASTTKRPAARQPRTVRSDPPLQARATAAVRDLILAAATSDVATSLGGLVGGAGASLVAVLTPRGPEPVLGASDDSL
jgi:lysophospholipase L1-like esterase